MSGALVQPCGNAGCDKTFQPQRFGRRQRYCSPRCRTAAHRLNRLPRETEADAIEPNWPTCPTENIGELDRLSLQNGRTAPQSDQGSPRVREGLLTAPATFVTESPIGRPSRHPKAIPDAIYAGMYRVRWPDGRLSDMANLTRVNDAIADFMERPA